MILIILTLLPALVIAGGVLFAPKSPFDSQDKLREESLYAALGREYSEHSGQAPLPDGERYIVRFKSNATLDEIYESLSDLPYRLLAESESRLFVISGTDKSFFEKNSALVEYYEPDVLRESLALTNDPLTLPVYESAGITSAWDSVTADEGIIVAVLDTGVDRRHEELSGIRLLAGYDAVTKSAGVDGDSVGHGTGVIGIIAAEANNVKGIAGVAHGVTVLPVKVSAGSTSIYSSDLIAGIRFAADAGAKIINMSVGGYSSSYAEQEAVNYASEKGCILIAAAGNGGNRPYADQKSYPASYENVISVASCNENGERSDFSQYNDAVDVAINGELLTMPYVDENGASVYRTDSGTSYSCALVSGIAALAATKAGKDVRFGNDEFLSLIISACGNERTDELGYGVLNALSVVERADLPIVTGVSDGGIYNDALLIGYNRGTALLDGEPFEDGERVMANGRHTLTVNDGENEVTIAFTLDYDPLSYKYREYAAFSYFEFSQGTALLNGFPYSSGERISSSGRHEFVLSDDTETIGEVIFLQYTPPEVFGIEDGGIYNNPVEISVVGEGIATLDGVEIFGEAAVCESGLHTLTVKSPSGAVTKEYRFEINFDYAITYDTDYACGKAAIDEENGYFCLYGDSLVGARIYNLLAPEQYIHFLPIGRIYSHVFTEDSLILFGDNGISVLDRKTALLGSTALTELGAIGEMSYYLFADGEIYGFGGNAVRKISLDGGYEDILRLTFEAELALYSEGKLCMLAPSTDKTVRVYDIESGTLTSFELDTSPDGLPICFAEGLLAAGNRLYDVSDGSTLLEFCSVGAVKIENGLLFTEKRIIEIESGKEIGSFVHEVSDIAVTERGCYLFGVESVMTFTEIGPEGIFAYGAAERTVASVSSPEAVNPYRTNLFYPAYTEVTDSKTVGSRVFFLLRDSNRLYSFDCESLAEYPAVSLRFLPKSVSVSGGYIAITFENSKFIYLAREDGADEGAYIAFSENCTSAAVADGKLFAVSDGVLAYCSVNGEKLTETSIRAELIASDGERIYALGNGSLNVYSPSLATVAGITTDAEYFVLGSGIAVGGAIYDRPLTAQFGYVSDKVLALRNGVTVTEKGVYSFLLDKYTGSLGTEAATSAVITESNAVVSFGGSIISVCRFPDGVPVTQQPNVSGVQNGSIYIDGTVIEYDIGSGYLDGKPFESGDTASGAGAHRFLITLPCGQSVSYDFTIEAKLESIEFLVKDRIMSVGEAVNLRIKYNPNGASSVPVTFSCSSDGLTVSETGAVTANEVGVYTVTAEAVTEHGKFLAECRITVRDDLIVFTEESGIRIDRNNALIIGVQPATDASTLISMLKKPENVRITDKNGDAVSGIVGTGAVMTLKTDGEITDTLTVVVIGDCDGDGYTTAYDLYLLERILRGYSFDAPSIAAADINGNGIVADIDYRALRNKLLRPENDSIILPEYSLFGIGSVQTPTFVESGSVIDVAVCISGCKYARGVSGILQFGEGLEFISAESFGWDADAKDIGNGKISFYSHGDDGANSERAFKLLLNLRFRVTAEAGSAIEISSEGFVTAFESGSKTVHFDSSQIFVHASLYGELNIELKNASGFEFNPDIYEYNATIPYNSALADIAVTRPEGTTVLIEGAAISESGLGTVSISLTDENGVSTLYTIRVKREQEPRFDTNCRLSTLEIEGARLSPSFDPDILVYDVQLPYGSKKVNIYCVAQNPSARVVISDTEIIGDSAVITITVGSPDGETLVYTLNVTVMPEEAESLEESLPENDGNGISLTVVLSIIGGIAVAAAIILLYIRLAKQDEQIRNEHSDIE